MIDSSATAPLFAHLVPLRSFNSPRLLHCEQFGGDRSSSEAVILHSKMLNQKALSVFR